MPVKGVDVERVRWHRSSYSNHDGGNCVEVARGLQGVVPVRDSKDRGGPLLAFGPSAFGAFLDAVKGEGGSLR